MGKLFGTDGIRGVVGENLTAELAFKVGKAVATVLEKEKQHAPVITIGKDTRISSDMLEAALTAGICSVGGNVIPLGTMPTPAVAYITVLSKSDAGIVISASHNPFEHNGIKVFNSQGYKLSDMLEAQVEEMILSGEKIPIKTCGEIGHSLSGMETMREEYIDHLLETVTVDLSGIRVLVDCANGASSVTAPTLFNKLPLIADFISVEPNGININNDCGSTHLNQLAQKVVEGEYDLGIAFDGDADRCLLVDEKGNTIDGDKVLAVCGLYLRKQGKLNGDAIVATVMSNLGLHEFCDNNNIHLICTSVGDRNVLENMLENDYMIGGEQSGHTIFREFATTGDGELTALQFLQAYKEAGKTASELVSCCKQYPQELINVKLKDLSDKENVMKNDALWAEIRKVETAMNGKGRILIRPSGTEALIRVMVEAVTDEEAMKTAQNLADFIKNLIK